MPDSKRRLILRIGGPLAQAGRVPLSLLARKLEAIQRLLFNIGSALRGGGHRGQWKAEVIEACELDLIDARFGSLEIIAEVPLLPALPIAGLDLGLQAIERLGLTLDAIRSRDRDSLANLYQDFGQRVRVLKSVDPLLPEDGADYDVSLVAGEMAVDLRPEYKGFIAASSRTDDQLTRESVHTLTGVLYRLEVATGTRQIGIIVNNRHIPCFYPPEYEDAVRELVPGSLVEVEGRASLNSRGHVQRIEEVFDARSVQLVPLYWRRVVYGERIFRFRRPIEIAVDFRDDLWVHEYEPLNLLGYAPTRSESLSALRMQFAATWDYIAHESDERLTGDAQLIKNLLRDLVEAEETLA